MKPAAALAIALLLLGSACQREKRELRPGPEERGMLTSEDRHSGLTPATPQAGSEVTGPMRSLPTSSPYAGNAYAISEGQRLFNWFNCVGCHSNGGGGIGPSLMDKVWIYGSSPPKIYESIAKGRPHGMPAFGSKAPEYQIWQLVAFVRSLSGDQPRSATAARQDSIQVQNSDIRKRKPLP